MTLQDGELRRWQHPLLEDLMVTCCQQSRRRESRPAPSLNDLKSVIVQLTSRYHCPEVTFVSISASSSNRRVVTARVTQEFAQPNRTEIRTSCCRHSHSCHKVSLSPDTDLYVQSTSLCKQSHSCPSAFDLQCYSASMIQCLRTIHSMHLPYLRPVSAVMRSIGPAAKVVELS
jgi:hypothetical protein